MAENYWANNAQAAAKVAVLQNGIEMFAGNACNFARWLKPRVGPIVGIFGSAREPEASPQMAELHRKYAPRVLRVGRLLGDRGASMISGHCPGIPELAEEAFKQARHHVETQPLIGVRIVLRQPDGAIFEETDSSKVDIYIETPLFGPRIEVMEALADGAIFPPGGIGTRLELMLFIQKLQLGHYLKRRIPLVLLGREHWAEVIDDFSRMCDDGTLDKREFWVEVTDDPEEAVDIVLRENGNADRARRATQGKMF